MKHRGYTAIELGLAFFYLVVLPAAVFGWGWNIYKIATSDFGQITGLLVLRVIGVFVAPLGAVVGYF
jgi:hypothetical protein